MSDILYRVLQEHGISYPKEEVTNCKFTRWGKNAKFWARQFAGGYIIGDFVEDKKWYAFEKDRNYENCKNEIREIKRKWNEEIKFGYAKAAIDAQQKWNNATICETHPYLESKKIKSYGLKIENDTLLIPLFDENDVLVSVQKIFFDSREGKFVKRFHAGARSKGCFLVLGEVRDEVIICEGYATGASIHECLEKPVVVAFSSGSLCDVAKTIRKKYPDAKITIAADNDKFTAGNPGLTKAKEAAMAIQANIIFPEFQTESEKLTDFNDLHTSESAEKVRELFKKAEKEICESMVDGFRLTENELSYFDERSKRYIFVSGYIKVIAQTDDWDKENAGRLLEFKTRKGQLKKRRILDCWLSKDGDQVREILLKAGLKISTNHGAKLKLNEYINNCDPPIHAKFVKVSGWYKNGFITENGFIGEAPKELVIHQSDAEPSFVETSGSLESWTENIGKPSIGNSRLVLAISAAFASIFLKLGERENFGIHFVGNSSEGKTTALYVAASVFGGHKYIKPWKATDNGLECVAVTHNDMLLILDEIGQMDSKKIGDAVYMLANGMGKTRANIHGAARQSQLWRIGVLSSGEKDLATHMAESNKKMYAGQGIRLLTIPAKPTPESKGLLEKLNGFSNFNTLANHLKDASGKYYGTPLRAFVQALLKEQNPKKSFDAALLEAKEKHLPAGADGQDYRVFDIFFTFGFAGELATSHGITGWPAGEALTAALKCFNDWLSDKGGVGNQEEKQMLAQIKYFFETYGHVRFQRMVNHKIFDTFFSNERAGYVEARSGEDSATDDVYYVFPEYFKNVIAKGLSMRAVNRLLINRRIMEPEDGRHLQARISVNGKQQRMYLINSRIFGEQK
jgi:putative DNA primase/helicase